MTLKDLQEEGNRKITDKFFSVARDNEQRIWTLPKEFTGTEEELQSFLKSQTSLAYKLALDMVLKEIWNLPAYGTILYPLEWAYLRKDIENIEKLLQANPR